MIWKKSLFMSAPVLFAFTCVVSIHTATLSAQLPPPAHDPGVRGGAAGARRAARGPDGGPAAVLQRGKSRSDLSLRPSLAIDLEIAAHTAELNSCNVSRITAAQRWRGRRDVTVCRY